MFLVTSKALQNLVVAFLAEPHCSLLCAFPSGTSPSHPAPTYISAIVKSLSAYIHDALYLWEAMSVESSPVLTFLDTSLGW